MHSFQFWKSWSRPYQLIFTGSALIAIISVLFFGFAALQGAELTYSWERFQTLEVVSVPLRSFQLGIFDLAVQAENHIVFESMLGGATQIHSSYLYVALFLITLGAILLVSTITTLPRFWFLGGMGLFILFLSMLRLEAVQLFGFTNKIPAGTIFFLYVALGFYFHSFKSETPYSKRIISFAMLTLVVAALLAWGAGIKNPMLHLAANSLGAGIILTILFLILVAHEIVASFVWIVGQGSKKNNLRHFLIITFIYLINLILPYLIHAGYLKWDLWAINFYFLFTLSAALGVWGYRQREPQYQSIFSADPFGVIFYLSLAMISFATLGAIWATANDPVTTMFDRLILYTHIGYGIIFFAYVISNFSPMLLKNMPVFKVLYKPNTMPYFTFRIMGLIASYAFLAYDTTWKNVIDQALGGYYNSVADVYLAGEDKESATAYYNRSGRYRHLNHHAHYALANLYAEQLEPEKEKQEYAKAIESNPSEFAYMNLSETFDRMDQTDAAIITLKKGLEKFPGSGPLVNGLGILFLKKNQTDSALHFFEKARLTSEKDVAVSNLIAQSAKIKSGFPADSLLKILGSKKEGPRANALAMANNQNQKIDLSIEKSTDTVMSVYRAALLGNYFINQGENADTTLLSAAVTDAQRPSNGYFKEEVMMAAAHAYYQMGFMKRAFGLVRQLAYLTGKYKYNQLLGLWSLEKRNAVIAAEYFEKARNQQSPDAEYYQAIALSECDSLKAAGKIWESVATYPDTTKAKMAKKMIRIFSMSRADLDKATDEERYAFLHYRTPLADSITFWFNWAKMKDQELKARAVLERAMKWYDQDEIQSAIFTLARIKGLQFTNAWLYDEMRYFNLRLVAENQNWNVLREQVELQKFDGMHRNEKIYYEALLYELAGNKDGAKEKYKYLMAHDLHFEEGISAASHFLDNDKAEQEKVYAQLVDALLIRPHSIKLQKAYVIESARLGFEEEAQQTLEKLRKRLTPEGFNKFIDANPEIFTIQ